MGQSRPLFVYFGSFEKSVDGVLGIRTRGRRMVGADETTELWRPPINDERYRRIGSDPLLLLLSGIKERFLTEKFFLFH